MILLTITRIRSNKRHFCCFFGELICFFVPHNPLVVAWAPLKSNVVIVSQLPRPESYVRQISLLNSIESIPKKESHFVFHLNYIPSWPRYQRKVSRQWQIGFLCLISRQMLKVMFRCNSFTSILIVIIQVDHWTELRENTFHPRRTSPGKVYFVIRSQYTNTIKHLQP